MATKTRLSLSADEVVGVRMRVEDLRPGMVFTDGILFCVYLSEDRVRILGTETESPMTSTISSWAMNHNVTVCCTRSPSMQFILK